MSTKRGVAWYIKQFKNGRDVVWGGGRRYVILNAPMVSGERRELPQWGVGRSPSRNRIWCILPLKSDIWCQTNLMIFLRIK